MKKRFTDAIKDSIFHLSDIIREKSNLEGDGTQLVGEAFAGTAPKIRVTKLQSENEKNVQRGVESLLRGLYQAIRNPRSHEKYSDSKEDADAIILFVDYLLRVVSQSKAQFTLESYLQKVFDNSFVKSEQYADLLVSEIPTKRRMEVMLEVLREKQNGECEKLHYFFQALISVLENHESEEVLQLISEELRTTDAFESIRNIIQLLDPADWPKLHKAARLRIENKLVQSIAEGAYNRATRKCSPGALGTWATGLFPHFALRTQAMSAIAKRLFSDSVQAQDYALQFFVGHLPSLMNAPPDYLTRGLIERLEKGDQRFFDALDRFEFLGKGPWTDAFKEALSRFVATEATAPEPDDVPF